MIELYTHSTRKVTNSRERQTIWLINWCRLIDCRCRYCTWQQTATTAGDQKTERPPPTLHPSHLLSYPHRGHSPSLLECTFYLPTNQCSGFVSFWAFRIRISNYLNGFGSFHQQAKRLRKTLISTVMWLVHDLISLKTVLNVPVVCYKRNKKTC